MMDSRNSLNASRLMKKVDTKERQGGEKLLPVKIGNHLFGRLMEHIHELAILKKTQISKQEWLTAAIEEKLRFEKKSPKDGDLLKQKSVFPRISPELNEELEEQVNQFKKSRKSYSKKQWVVDAIYEKLDRDDKRVKEMLKEKFLTSLDNHL